MRDTEIVALLAAGDTRGLEAAYAAYADRIHDYARGLLRSDDDAADVTHDTFLIALAKAGGLRNPDRLRSWLYAVARNECLRVLRAAGRTEPLDQPAVEAAQAEGSTDMSTGLAQTDLKELVHAAAEGLSPKDREVFDLGMRHDLQAREVALALGVSDNAAHAMMSRVRAQFERSLGALVVARQGRGSCAELATMLSSWDGTFDPLWRKRIARHVSSCEACGSVQRHGLKPAALLGILPLMAAPVSVRDRLFGTDQLALVAHSGALAARASAEGGLPPLGDPPRSRRAGFLVAAVLLLLIGVVTGAALLTRQGDVPLDVAGAPTTMPSITAPQSSAPEATLSLAPAPSQSPTPSPSPSPTPRPTASSTPSEAPPTPQPEPQPEPEPEPEPDPEPEPEGDLVVRPAVLTMSRGARATVVLAAEGGDIGWTATLPPYVSASATSGTVEDGELVTVTLVLDPATPRAVATQVVTFSPGGVTVTITVGP